MPKDKYDIYFIGFQESGWTSGAKIPQTQILSYMWDTRTAPHTYLMFAVDAERCPTTCTTQQRSRRCCLVDCKSFSDLATCDTLSEGTALAIGPPL